MDEFILSAEGGAGTGDHSVELFLATVGSSNSSGVTLQFDGASAATTKRFKCVGARPAAGARVAVLKQAGTYIVLGAISANGGGSGSVYTEVISEICTSSSDFTVTEAKYNANGGSASFFIKGKWNNTISTAGWITVCTLVSGKRPAFESIARSWSSTSAFLYGTGVLYFYGTVTQNSEATFIATYTLA